MAWLDLIPGGRWLLIGGAAVLLAAVGVQTLRLGYAQIDLAEVKAAWSADREQAAERTRDAEAAARAKEQQWIKDQKERDDANDLKLQGLRADAAIADAAAGRLLQRVAALAAAARQAATGATTVDPGPPTADPAGMLADVLGRCIGRVRVLAAIADERGAAGQLCERSYDAVTVE